jgi:hypothetical protein
VELGSHGRDGAQALELGEHAELADVDHGPSHQSVWLTISIIKIK